jgi:hypothetical protein
MRCAKSLIVFFILIFSSTLFSELLINEPRYGEELEILITDGNDKSVSIIDPDGEKIELEIEKNQVQVPMHKEGRWIVLYGEEREEVQIYRDSQKSIETKIREDEERSLLPMTWIMIMLTMTMFASVMAAVYFIFLKDRERKKPRFSKVCENGYVRVVLQAGSQPLRDVKIQDSVGREWKNKPLNMCKKELEAFRSLELVYQYQGPMDRAICRFYEDEKFMVLESSDVGENKNESEKSAKKRLSRI